MAITTHISWTDSTFNPWIGCTNVSAGCDHCYAETLNSFRGWTQWGPHGVRRETSDATWKHPEKWQRQASAFTCEQGRRRRVFCASLADVFDNKAPPGARDRLWKLIRATPDLDWQLLTKRPQNIHKMLPPDWGDGYPNVWLGTTTEDQETLNQRWPVLASTPARVRFLSYEPAIGPARLLGDPGAMRPDWVIFGGESGPGARTADPQWARDMRDDCQRLGVAFFLKQWGTYESSPLVCEEGLRPQAAMLQDAPANGKGGALLDGRLWREFPASIFAPELELI
jgi:protein gp37